MPGARGFEHRTFNVELFGKRGNWRFIGSDAHRDAATVRFAGAGESGELAVPGGSSLVAGGWKPQLRREAVMASGRSEVRGSLVPQTLDFGL